VHDTAIDRWSFCAWRRFCSHDASSHRQCGFERARMQTGARTTNLHHKRRGAWLAWWGVGRESRGWDAVVGCFSNPMYHPFNPWLHLQGNIKLWVEDSFLSDHFSHCMIVTIMFIFRFLFMLFFQLKNNSSEQEHARTDTHSFIHQQVVEIIV